MSSQKPGRWCNKNGSPDDLDLAAGASKDCNANSVPDECEAAPVVDARPRIHVPGNITVECEGASGTAVTFAVTASDACDPAPTVTATPASGSIFPVGTTQVGCTATDAAGNTSQGAFEVIVADTRPPSIQCPANISLACKGAAGSAVTFDVTASDACDPAPAVVATPASGSILPTGTTQVLCTATDAAGNTSQCDFEVTVGVCNGGLQLPGDCNQDGTIDLSDAICLLGFLFLGKPSSLPCGDGTELDAANRDLVNWNGDGQVDLSDAVGVLTWLFGGGPAHVLGSECRRTLGCPEGCAAGA